MILRLVKQQPLHGYALVQRIQQASNHTLARRRPVDVYTCIGEAIMPATFANRTILTGGIAWVALALAVGATGVLATVPPPGPQLVILVLTATAIWSTNRGALRFFVDRIPLRALVGFHAIRFVGFVFLLMAAQGVLSPLFATRAGWGDIAAAVLALSLVATGEPTTAGSRRAYHAWNAFATLDLLVAVGTATQVALRGDSPGVEPLLAFPMVVVPLVVVPLLFASHVAVFRRLRQAGGA
jgi:hypothetical protein